MLAVLAVAALFVPRAAIKLEPISQAQSVVLPVTASPSVQSVLITGSLPAHEITITVSGQQAAQITSKTSIPQDKASGIVRFTNLSQSDLSIPAGTVVFGIEPETVRFVTLNDTHLPGNINAVVEVPIEAMEGGEAGNLPADAIQAVNGNLGLSISVTNPEPTSGGSDRLAVAPADSDRQRVHEVLTGSLQTQAQNQLSDSLGGQDLLLTNTLKMGQVLGETYDPPAGQPGNLLTLSMCVEYSAQYITGADLTQLAQATLNASLPEGFGPVPGTLAFHAVQTPIVDESGASQFNLQIERKLVREIDPARVNALVRGLPPEAAAQVLGSDLPLVSAPQIDLSPSWWPWLPLIPFRIEVN